MRTIAHLSDLHFGTEDACVVEGLLADLAALAPDLVVVSGDLTQRAREAQFERARDFLARIDAEKLVVPGNHDIPLWDVFRRLTQPLARYRRHIGGEEVPWFFDGEVAAAGIATPRRNLWKEGRVSTGDIRLVRERFCALPDEVLKVLVTHHPFVPKDGTGGVMPLARGERALDVLGACGADLLLSGHQHVGRQGLLSAYYPDVAHSILVVEAGTAVSRRHRGEPNTFNRIAVDGPHVAVEVRGWDGARFLGRDTARFEHRGGRWERA